MIMVDTSKCPCGTGKPYPECCKPLHQGLASAKTAEELMRSRYTAYVKKLKDYLLATWHPNKREEMKNLDFEDGLRWLGLKITSTKAGLENDSEGEVNFIASYSFNSKSAQVNEHSHFIKEDGYWYYTGEMN